MKLIDEDGDAYYFNLASESMRGGGHVMPPITAEPDCAAVHSLRVVLDRPDRGGCLGAAAL